MMQAYNYIDDDLSLDASSLTVEDYVIILDCKS